MYCQDKRTKKGLKMTEEQMYNYCYSQMDEDGLCSVCTACSAPTFTNLACEEKVSSNEN